MARVIGYIEDVGGAAGIIISSAGLPPIPLIMMPCNSSLSSSYEIFHRSFNFRNANSQLDYENKQAASKNISSCYALVCLLSPSVFANYFLFKRDKMPFIKPKYYITKKTFLKDLHTKRFGVS